MKEAFRQVLFSEIVTNMPALQDSSLLSGKSGALLALSYYSRNNAGLRRTAQKTIELLVNILVSDLSEAAQSKPFFAGLTGPLWVLHNLKSQGHIRIKDEPFLNHAAHINQALLDYAAKNEYDNLNGSFGILNYLADTRTLDGESLDAFLALYKNRLYVNGRLSLIAERSKTDPQKKTYDFSLAHGLSGKILILMKAYDVYPSAGLKKLVDDLCDCMLGLSAFENINVNCPVFPSVIEQSSQKEFDFKRLAWCYGDLGSAFAIYKYSLRFKNQELYEQVMALFTKLSQKRGLHNNAITGVPFATGTSGVSYIFHKLFTETGLPQFKEAADYWEAETEKLYYNSNTGALKQDASRLLSDLGLLEGLSGIMLALDTRRSNNFSWDGCLLLN